MKSLQAKPNITSVPFPLNNRFKKKKKKKKKKNINWWNIPFTPRWQLATDVTPYLDHPYWWHTTRNDPVFMDFFIFL